MADTAAFFNEFLPAKLKENPEMVHDINAVYQFEIEGAGSWSVDLTGEGAVTAGTHAEPGCVVTIADEDFGTLLDNPAMAIMLFSQGKLQVSDLGLAMSLQKILG